MPPKTWSLRTTMHPAERAAQDLLSAWTASNLDVLHAASDACVTTTTRGESCGPSVDRAWTNRYHGVCLSFPSARTFSKKLFSENGIIADQTSPPYQNRPTSSTLIALSPPSTGRFKRRCTHRGIAYPLGCAAMCATLDEMLLP